jgi:hypothetical protein
LITVGEWCSSQLIGTALMVGISAFLDQSHYCAIEHIHLVSLCTVDTPFLVGSLYWLANNLMRLLRLDGAPPDGLVVLSSPLPLVWAIDGMGFFVCSCGGDLYRRSYWHFFKERMSCGLSVLGSVHAGYCGHSVCSSCSRACLVSSQYAFTYSGSSSIQ